MIVLFFLSETERPLREKKYSHQLKYMVLFHHLPDKYPGWVSERPVLRPVLMLVPIPNRAPKSPTITFLTIPFPVQARLQIKNREGEDFRKEVFHLHLFQQ